MTRLGRGSNGCETLGPEDGCRPSLRSVSEQFHAVGILPLHPTSQRSLLCAADPSHQGRRLAPSLPTAAAAPATRPSSPASWASRPSSAAGTPRTRSRKARRPCWITGRAQGLSLREGFAQATLTTCEPGMKSCHAFPVGLRHMQGKSATTERASSILRQGNPQLLFATFPMCVWCCCNNAAFDIP